MKRKMIMERAIIFGILFVFLLVITVAAVEFFIPLNMKYEMNSQCRGTLLEIETKGYLVIETKSKLEQTLIQKGFTNVSITSSGGTRQGDEITLRVEAQYSYSKLVSLFSREQKTLNMIFEKTTTVRRVVN